MIRATLVDDRLRIAWREAVLGARPLRKRRDLRGIDDVFTDDKRAGIVATRLPVATRRQCLDEFDRPVRDHGKAVSFRSHVNDRRALLAELWVPPHAIP